MPAKVIVKSGYIKNVQHMTNALDYAGNKIEAQLAVMSDGSTMEIGATDFLNDDAELTSIRITMKGSKTKELTPEKYWQYVHQKANLHQEQILIWEDRTKQFDPAYYIQYIAHRPSVEKSVGKTHGLFTLDGDTDIELEKQKLLQCNDCLMWSHIISLEREDADRTGYDHRSAWQNLVTAKSMDIAKTYNIDPQNLVVNAAYHDKDHHPHLHLYFYSTDPREGVVKDMEYASKRLKSLFFNEIFKDDVSYLKAVRTDQREQLEARLEELMQGINKQSYKPPKAVCDKLLELSVALRSYKGKNVYAFHKPQIKAQVDELVELMVSQDRHLSALFSAYLDTQRKFIEQYNEKPEKIERRMEEFMQHFFHPRPARRGKPGSGDRAVLHNEVLRYALAFSGTMPADVQKNENIQPPRPDGETAKKETPILVRTHESPPDLENNIVRGKSKEYNQEKKAYSKTVAADVKIRVNYRKKTKSLSTIYTATLLMRTCARELGKLARENDQYNDREEKQESNITERRNPKEQWHNYTESYGYD